MDSNNNFSILKLDENLRYALVQDFVIDKNDMLKQEKLPSQNNGGGFMQYINPKTKDRVSFTPYSMIYLGNRERKFNLNKHTYAMLKKVLDLKFTYRTLMLEEFKDAYKPGLDRTLVLENKRYLENQEARVREKLSKTFSDEKAKEIKSEFLEVIKTEQAKLQGQREAFGLTQEQ